MTISFLLHCLGLIIPGVWLGRALRLPLASCIGATLLIFEMGLILGAGLLSWVALLGNLLAYQLVTTFATVFVAACIWFIARHDPQQALQPSEIASSFAFNGKKSSITFVVSIIAAAVVPWIALYAFLFWYDLPFFGPAYKIGTLLTASGLVGAFTIMACRGLQLFSSQPIEPLRVSGRIRTWVYITPIACLAMFSLMMIWLALNSYPAVEDSLTIKLQKAVFAIEANTILPTNLTDDGRMYISPVYPSLLQLFFIINGQKTHALLLFGFANWALCGVAVHRICRQLEASILSTWIVTVLVLLTPTLIVQGTSEGDDIFAATPLLFSLLFFLNWVRTGHRLDAALCGLGLGLSIGIKFFPLFYAPVVPLIIIMAILRNSITDIVTWTRTRLSGAMIILVFFFLSLMPNAISNSVAFGNPFFVSSSVLATRNSPFSYDCAARTLAGYMKQLIFSDALRLVSQARALIFSFPHAPRSFHYIPIVDNYNHFLARILPYDPILACSAWGNNFIVTNWYESDNTYWYGIFGPFLIVSSIAILLSRKHLLITQSIAAGFIVWAITFAFSQKYIGEIGRYWSLPILAASPAVAVFLDHVAWREPASRAKIWLAAFASALAIVMAFGVLINNQHRSLIKAALGGSRYVTYFPEEVRSAFSKAASVNIFVTYSINTYDYYMILGPTAKIVNKAQVLDDHLNYVLVRPYGLVDNPYSDPRIALRMNRPFARGFKFLGEVPLGLGFANNTDTAHANLIDDKSLFLLFQVQLQKEAESITGTLVQIASPSVIDKVIFRLGWLDSAGQRRMVGDWNHGLFGSFTLPGDTQSLVIQAAFADNQNDIATAEWPMKDFTPTLIQKLN